MRSTSPSDGIVVVVPAYNEERHIARCLRSLQRQTLPAREIIVVDDGSSDTTPSIAADFNVTVVRTPHRGPAHARNVGACSVQSSILVFVDADVECAPDYIENLVAPILQKGIPGTFSKEIFIGNLSSPWAHSYARIRRLAIPRLLPKNHPDESANYRAIRRTDFMSVGGYDEVGYGEDLTLAPKLGRLAIAAPGAICWHYNPDSLWEIFENARWIGRGYDIGELATPWLSNAPWCALYKAFREVRRGAEWSIIPARLAYSLGIWLGLSHRTFFSERHWK